MKCLNTDPSSESIIIRAAFSSYLMLSGVWVVLAIGYLSLDFQNPGEGLLKGAVIAGGVALLWWVWLLGFKITVTNKFLEYRNGFFRTSKLALVDIKQIKDANVEWNVIGREIRVPRIVVVGRDKNMTIRINPKPFKRKDLQQVRRAINREKTPA